MADKVRCGAHYCEVCKKCIRLPKLRKNYMPDWWTICDECQPDVVEISFRPNEDSLETFFKVKHKDIPGLIENLKRAYEHQIHESSTDI